MPRAREHERISLVVGPASAVLFNIARQSEAMSRDPRRQIDWGEVVGIATLAGLVAVVAGALPDKIEPSSRGPRHRGFFHSATAFWLAGSAGIAAQGLTSVEPGLRDLLTAAGTAYAAHLAADAGTPAGIRVL